MIIIINNIILKSYPPIKNMNGFMAPIFKLK
uniref:Uncharacterized protein n=1 Tax=Lepeophtheirus salmonis TaxID=72036 RepID=A0A0K2TY79_LEPSM